jgi:hypothetical protein
MGGNCCAARRGPLVQPGRSSPGEPDRQRLRPLGSRLRPENRALPEAWRPPGRLACGNVSPDGRWLAVATGGPSPVGLAAWKEIGFLPLGRTTTWFTVGRNCSRVKPGCSAGPCRRRRTSCGSVRAQLRGGSLGRISLDREGRTLAVLGGGGGWIFDLDNPAGKVPALLTRTWSGSPPARTDGWSPPARTTRRHPGVGGEREHRPRADPDERIAAAAFSPDGRWLVLSTETAIDIWDIDKWERAYQLRRARQRPHRGVRSRRGPRRHGFHGGGLDRPGLRAAVRPAGVGHADLVSPVGFSRREPAGGFHARGRLRVWGLRLIRSRLAGVGLDWDRRAYPPPQPDEEPGKFESDLGEFARAVGAEHFRQGQKHAGARWTDAVAACTVPSSCSPMRRTPGTNADGLTPRSDRQGGPSPICRAAGLASGPVSAQQPGWMLVTCRETYLRDAAGALPAREAVRLSPKKARSGTPWEWSAIGRGLPGAIEAAQVPGVEAGSGCSDYFFSPAPPA